jgi:MoxR-like ATPase
MTSWKIFKGTRQTHDGIKKLGEPPNWRKFNGLVPKKEYPLPPEDQFERRYGEARFEPDKDGEATLKNDINIDESIKELVNAALYLRRPLFITGKPGSGKSSLAYAVAHELGLGKVLRWPITSRSTLLEGLYHYDAIGRLQNAKEGDLPDISQYLRLGPLGTALLPRSKPRVLLIDEIDKSDINLPNDLLNIFEDGEFYIPEIGRLRQNKVEILTNDSNQTIELEFSDTDQGYIRCHEFPFIVMTSNEEKEFPPAFLRRCLRAKMEVPKGDALKNIVIAHLGKGRLEKANEIFNFFKEQNEGKEGDLATDQLLNAIYLVARGAKDDLRINEETDKQTLLNALLKPLVND